MRCVLKFYAFLCVLVNICSGYNILVVFPHLGRSHFDVFVPFLTNLVQKGHNITVIGYSSLNIKHPNYRYVELDPVPTGDILELKFTGARTEMYDGAPFVHRFAKITTEIGLKSQRFQKFLKEDNTFDLLLIEYFNTNCFMGLVERYQAPVIGMSSCALLPWHAQYVGSPDHPAYVPVTFMDYYDKMTFFERVENTLAVIGNKIYYKYVMEPFANEFSIKYTGIDVLNPTDVMYNTSLILVNTHFSLHKPRPLVPGIVEVGGIHLGTPKKLPANIESWISESKEGVIYFSLGSMIKGHTFPEEKRQAFLKAFARLPQRVLWKWENDTMHGKPDNVMIQKWMPQFDVLCHPNVKAFISHGGLLGTTESVHCGVPMLVMPQYGDQHLNAKAVKSSGGGLILYLSEATEDNIYESLVELLKPRFQEQTKELSERFRDRPMSPLDTAIYWVEYVARHKGAPHMRTAAVDMPFYQYYLLDVLGFLLTVLFGMFYIFYKSVGIVISLLFSKSDISVKQNGKKSKRKVN